MGRPRAGHRHVDETGPAQAGGAGGSAASAPQHATSGSAGDRRSERNGCLMSNQLLIAYQRATVLDNPQNLAGIG
jgi:hypothetical protein